MALYDHYLIEDKEQLDANLIIMHQALINIIKGSTDADFIATEKSFIQFHKSYQVIHALHNKKINRNENIINEHMRRYYF